ncbi:hypothetical protein EJ07DRAFT_168768 [Lizonia empirigonia]|nr:hypothetical protein EJ07DRAFT_168768 [Lizonia empirigonia]
MQHCSTSLHNAAGAVDGGARSFPLASEAAPISRSQRDLEAAQQSAGWLVPLPNDASACKPVFIAHSVLSVIWLLRETLADNALSNSGWDCLVSAAQLLAEDSTAEPPSAQKPTASEPASDLDAQLDEPLLEEQPTTTTVTNCNRDAERKRIRDHKAAMLERSLDLSLITPDEKAANEEHGAYVAVPVQDRAVVSWLFKQDAVDKHRRKTDFYNAVKTPYLKARDFLVKARALGSPSSQQHAAHFLQGDEVSTHRV